jgi:hypothetical protein
MRRLYAALSAGSYKGTIFIGRGGSPLAYIAAENPALL